MKTQILERYTKKPIAGSDTLTLKELAVTHKADLRGADLRGADLRGADLVKATGLSPLIAAQLSIVPETGAFIAYKKLRGGVIATLEIPADAKRSNATGRKCRASHARVLALSSGEHVGTSLHKLGTKYVVGQSVTADGWEEDRWIECASGIHFFITKFEAEHYEG